jgi:hypothetical protein
MRIKRSPLPPEGDPRREVYDALLGFTVAFTAVGHPVNYDLARRERKRFFEHAGCLADWIGADGATQLISLVHSMEGWLYWCEPGDPDIGNEYPDCADDEIVFADDGPPDVHFVYSFGQQIHKWIETLDALMTVGHRARKRTKPASLSRIGKAIGFTGDNIKGDRVRKRLVEAGCRLHTINRQSFEVELSDDVPAGMRMALLRL